MAWKVFSVALRPFNPGSNFIVGVQLPKSRPAMLEATNPSKLPVMAFFTAPTPDPVVAPPVAAISKYMVSGMWIKNIQY